MTGFMWIENPPLDKALTLDMDYFLNEDVFGDDFGEEGFYIF